MMGLRSGAVGAARVLKTSLSAELCGARAYVMGHARTVALRLCGGQSGSTAGDAVLQQDADRYITLAALQGRLRCNGIRERRLPYIYVAVAHLPWC